MHIPSTIRLPTGRAVVPRAPMVHVALTPHELHTLALAIERQADTARADGIANTAATLEWRAAALREAARLSPTTRSHNQNSFARPLQVRNGSGPFGGGA